MLRSTKTSFVLLLALLTIFTALSSLMPAKISALSGSDWNAGRIIDDNVFYNQGSLTVDQIQSSLVQHLYDPATGQYGICDTNGVQAYGNATRASYGTSKGYPPPYTCLKDYSQAITSQPSDQYCNTTADGTYSAAAIIHEVARACGINSAALVVLLEKEQSLVSDPWPFSSEYKSAAGYGCPDTSACDSKYYGFFNQVYNAAWQFKYYAANPSSFRYMPYQANTIQYSPNTSCGSSSVYIVNKATAGLYNYTPYQPNTTALSDINGSQTDGCSSYGNRNFWRLFNNWFGNTLSPVGLCNTGLNITTASSGADIKKLNYGTNNNLGLILENNTGSGCVEIHPWDPGYQTWATHIVTNLPAFNPDDGSILPLASAPNDRLVFVKYSGANNMVEVHEWAPGYQAWASHIVTNQDASELSNGKLVSLGNKLLFVKYKNTANGKIEVHEWAPGYQAWASHIVTNQDASELSNGKLVSRGDHLVFVKNLNTANGNVEVHEWAPGYQAWASHIVTNTSTPNLQP